MSGTGTRTYAKITGTVAEEIDTEGVVSETRRIGPVSATEMNDVLLRARNKHAEAVVFECMAVAPRLIWFIQNKIVQASIVIIPTIRLDHLEDEGDTLAGITKSILSELKFVKVLITGEQSKESLTVMTSWAKKNHVELIRAIPSENTPAISGHHPTNVETALHVASHLGIKASDAIDAMLTATTEPDAEIGWEIIRNNQVLRFSDLGGANDPQSSAEAILRSSSFSEDATLVPILVNRWDRPLRTIAFAYSLRPSPNVPSVGIIGPAIPQVRKALRDQGFRSDQIHHIGWRSSLTHRLVIHKLLDLKGDHPHAWFAMVENIHAFPADQIRKTVHSVGSPVKKDSSPNLEADNA
jgi:poly-gamma-glutamate synthase PgsB/CapB